MANPTRDDVIVPPNVWTELNASAGVVGGDTAVVQNVGTHPIRVATDAAAPSTPGHGIVLAPGEMASLVVATSLWVRHEAPYDMPVNAHKAA